MPILYFIPGLGADERLFSRLQLDGFEKQYIHWITPIKNESLPGYAKRISAQIDTARPFALVGVSFGGMIAVEISKLFKPEKLILISSAKTWHEIPFTLRIFQYVPLYKLFSESFIRWVSKMNKRRFGIFKHDEMNLFAEMLLSCPLGYLKGAIHMILQWRNEQYPASIIHIHGDNDHLIPLKGIQKPVVIKGGTHFMPYHNAAEVERIVSDVLKGK